MPIINCQIIGHCPGLMVRQMAFRHLLFMAAALKQNAKLLIRVQEETIKAAVSKFFI